MPEAKSVRATWLSPVVVQSASEDERSRFRLYQGVVALGVVAPLATESVRWALGGGPSPTLWYGVLMSVASLVNYLLTLRHGRLLLGARIGLTCNGLLLGAVFLSENAGAPVSLTLLLDVAASVLVGGTRYGLAKSACWVLVVAGAACFGVPAGSPLGATSFLIGSLLGMAALAWAAHRARASADPLRDDILRLIDHSSDYIAILREGRVAYMNRAFVQLLGKDPRVEDVSASEFRTPEATRLLREVSLPHALAHGNWSGETDLIDKTGRVIPVLQTLDIHAYRDGKTISGTTIFKDITLEKQRQEELSEAKASAESALAAKSQFLANMSHEIRTPLNGVLGMAHVLWREIADPERRAELEVLIASGKHLLGVVNEILDFSKLEAGKISITSGPFSPMAVVKTSCALFESLARDKGLELRLEVPAEDVWVNSDEGRYRQVVTNLIQNAIKFTLSGSVTVRLTVEREGQRARFETAISDTGVGISQADRQRIFVAFEQADNSAVRAVQGTGLGLAIANRVAGLLGGSIEIDSEVGRGSTFRVLLTLPLAERPLPASQALSPAPFAAELAKKRVIVAEDNPINQLVVRRLLEQFGILATFVENGQELLDELALREYDIVFLDCHMPVLDGLEAARRIVASGRPRPRLVALTASAMPEEERRCRDAGMDDFLSKPLDPEKLVRALERI